MGDGGDVVKGHEPAALQLFVNEDESVAVKKDCLAGFAVFCYEKKQCPGEKLQVHFLDDNVGKCIVALPHIHVFGVEKYGILGIKYHGHRF